MLQGGFLSDDNNVLIFALFLTWDKCVNCYVYLLKDLWIGFVMNKRTAVSLGCIIRSFFMIHIIEAMSLLSCLGCTYIWMSKTLNEVGIVCHIQGIPEGKQIIENKEKGLCGGLWLRQLFDISSVASQKGAITIQRCSVENQKGAITIQRCSVENQKGAITIQRCSVENQKGTITIQRCSVENQKGAITIDFVQR